MKSKFWNTLTIFIATCFVAIAFILWWFGRGESVAVILRLLFAPFLLDVSRGLGQAGAQTYQWFSGASYFIVITMIVLRHVAQETVAKSAFTTIGIVLTIIHFVIVGVGYLSNGIH